MPTIIFQGGTIIIALLYIGNLGLRESKYLPKVTHLVNKTGRASTREREGRCHRNKIKGGVGFWGQVQDSPWREDPLRP
jgi:hypothetical protein